MNRHLINCGGIRLWLALWLCFEATEVLACRYNVRDIGFVDLGGEGYNLYAYLDASVPAEAIRVMKEHGTALEAETNLRFVPVDASVEPDHPGLKYRPVSSAPSVATGALVSPRGQVLYVPFPSFDSRFPTAWDEVLKGLWSSPKRDEIVRSVSQTFAAVLLIEGTVPEANRRARETVLASIAQIRGQMKSLPKVIAEPPVLLELPAASFGTEKVLLWSLGLEAQPTDLPVTAVFYGKGRWIGNTFKGAEITEANLMKVLSIIGADCECGIDISWTQGIRLPLRWRSELQAFLSQSLGFDPENPLVRIEASRILNKRGTGKNVSQGYQEVTLDDEATSPAPTVASGPSAPSQHHPELSTSISGGAASARNRELSGARSDAGAGVATRAWLTFGGLGLAVGCVGLGIFLRSRVKD